MRFNSFDISEMFILQKSWNTLAIVGNQKSWIIPAKVGSKKSWNTLAVVGS